MDRARPLRPLPRRTPARKGAALSFGDFFLTEPDLFPGRASGEPWGEAAVRLDLAGGPYRVAGLCAAQAAALARRFGPLAAPEAAPHAPPEQAEVPVRLFRAPESDFREFSIVGWTTRFDLEARPRAVLLAGRRFTGRLDWSEAGAGPRLGGAMWTPSEADADFDGLVENFLRVLVAHRAVERGGALLHSAGVAANGRAHVFFGPSGAGKSTLSALSAARGHEVLSDELNVLIEEGGELVVERLPFAGDFGREATAAPRRADPLAGLFLLEQAAAPARRPLPRARAVAALAAASPFVNGDPYRSPRLLENLERLTARVPVEVLAFALDPGFWTILEESP